MNDYLGAIIAFALFCFIIKRYITKEQIKELLSEGATVWAIIITIILFICTFWKASIFILIIWVIGSHILGFFDDINKPRT